jgi:hypothetical protein
MDKKIAHRENSNNLMRLTLQKKDKFIVFFFSLLRKIGGGNRFSNLIRYIEK